MGKDKKYVRCTLYYCLVLHSGRDVPGTVYLWFTV
jgi:hypothetical protein